MPNRPPPLLLRVQLLDRNRVHPLIPSRVAQHTKTGPRATSNSPPPNPAPPPQSAISRACATDTSPATSASRVSGHASTADTSANASRASRVVDPDTLASQSLASANPSLPMHPTRSGTSREPGLGRFTRLTRRRQLHHHPGGIVRRVHPRLHHSERLPQPSRNEHETPTSDTSSHTQNSTRGVPSTPALEATTRTPPS